MGTLSGTVGEHLECRVMFGLYRNTHKEYASQWWVYPLEKDGNDVICEVRGISKIHNKHSYVGKVMMRMGFDDNELPRKRIRLPSDMMVKSPDPSE